ncbi:helix-turn-helix domain-containing protein [Gemmiger formicilis]|uniref:helix-turn-helix domain-containing protein n=1 Tax=Gemmiger formicilis TaxID=745368 RepID=UPI0039931871
MEYPNIRSLREDHDFRQCDLASVLHVSQNTYSQYENGVIELTAERLVKLADFYNVSIDYLLGRTDNPEVNRGIQLRQHRIIPALRLKHRSGGCGTASALPKCSIIHKVLSALLA